MEQKIRPYEHVRGPEHARVNFKSDGANLLSRVWCIHLKRGDPSPLRCAHEACAINNSMGIFEDTTRTGMLTQNLKWTLAASAPSADARADLENDKATLSQTGGRLVGARVADTFIAPAI